MKEMAIPALSSPLCRLFHRFHRKTAKRRHNASDEATIGSRHWVFLFPELDAKDGGYLAQVRFASLTQELAGEDSQSGIRAVSYATYQSKHDSTPWLDSLLTIPPSNDTNTYCIHYGPHISALLKKLKGRRVIYFCHSTGWKINLPSDLPIIAVSRHCMGYWAKRQPSNPLYLLPNIVEDRFKLPTPKHINSSVKRPIDVLVLKRKMSSYLIHDLVPALLQQSLNVLIIDDWDTRVEERMQQSKIFLYDSSSYWKTHKASEGFGLPPLEAMACGCTIFSSLNDGLSDFLDPLFTCRQLLVSHLDKDVENIVAATKVWTEPEASPQILAQFRSDALRERLSRITQDINHIQQPK